MAGKNGSGISYTTQDVELMMNAFGTLIAAIVSQYEGVIKKYEAVAKAEDPFPSCSQKEPYAEIVAGLTEGQKAIEEEMKKSEAQLKKYTDAYESALQSNLNLANQAAQAVNQTAAKAAEK